MRAAEAVDSTAAAVAAFMAVAALVVVAEASGAKADLLVVIMAGPGRCTEDHGEECREGSLVADDRKA